MDFIIMKKIFLFILFFVFARAYGKTDNDFLEKARLAYKESKCALSVLYYDKSNNYNKSFDEFFIQNLALADQAKIATCYDWVAGDLKYYNNLNMPIDINKNDALSFIIQLTENPSYKNDYYTLSALLASTYQWLKTNHPQNTEHHKEILKHAILSAQKTDLNYITFRLYEEQKSYLKSIDEEVEYYLNRAASHRIIRNYDKAIKDYESALSIWNKSIDYINKADLHYLIALMAAKKNELTLSEKHLKEAFMLSKDDAQLQSDIAFMQADILIKKYQYDFALPLSQESLKYHETKSKKDKSPGELLAISERKLQLANIFRGLDRYQEADKLYNEVIETRRSLVGKSSDLFSEAIEEKLKLMYRQGLYQEADRLVKKIGEISVDIF
jgi:tetratricopeptide (TPR) repeat protein